MMPVNDENLLRDPYVCHCG